MLQFPTWKIVLVVSICLLGVVYAAPNAFERDAFGEVSAGLPGRQINLGLDLQGGSSLLLQVDTAVVVRERLDGIVEVARRELRDADIGYVGLGVRGELADFGVREAADLDRARRLGTEFEAGTEVSVDGNRVQSEEHTSELQSLMRI